MPEQKVEVVGNDDDVFGRFVQDHGIGAGFSFESSVGDIVLHADQINKMKTCTCSMYM